MALKPATGEVLAEERRIRIESEALQSEDPSKLSDLWDYVGFLSEADSIFP